ncbi:Hypothetical predicted protein [Mytilus galloprovincialis]|uniref:Uncharacterized protein n=1 Tax=Mytilus galloprovincialis TaxID=29158 RepID=A0A8B6EB47_MYTGA|nr:Hypothetical predicted protein [Mytilus galloprovincialis]
MKIFKILCAILMMVIAVLGAPEGFPAGRGSGFNRIKRASGGFLFIGHGGGEKRLDGMWHHKLDLFKNEAELNKCIVDLYISFYFIFN